MVGTDGVLIASDTRWTNSPILMDKAKGGRHTFDSPKIITNHVRGIAISCARNMETARHVAEEIISGLKDEDRENPTQAIEAIGTKVLRSARKRRDAHCLIAFTLPTPRLFLFRHRDINGVYARLENVSRKSRKLPAGGGTQRVLGQHVGRF